LLCSRAHYSHFGLFDFFAAPAASIDDLPISSFKNAFKK